MQVITIVILVFSLLGALDKLLGDKFGIGKEFEKAFSLFTSMVLSMLGMLVISPALGVWLTPFFDWFYTVCRIDPSIIPASLFANDMGGMTLAQAICKDADIGNFNAFIVSSMMGCVVSFTIPFSLGIVKREQHHELFFGLLCGIITIPLGAFVAGLMCGLGLTELLLTLLPLILFSVILAVLLIFCTEACIKVFFVFGHIIRLVAIVGLGCAIFTFLTKIQICEHFDTFENAAFVCVNACVTLSGTLPLMYMVAKLLNQPLQKISSKMGINPISAISLLSNMVTNVTSLGVMDKMNKKGVVLNAAFAVSAAFMFGGHLAFTMAFDSNYVLPMIVGKLLSGICAILLAAVLYKEKNPT